VKIFCLIKSGLKFTGIFVFLKKFVSVFFGQEEKRYKNAALFFQFLYVQCYNILVFLLLAGLFFCFFQRFPIRP